MSILNHIGFIYSTCSRHREFNEACAPCRANRAVYLCVKEGVLCEFCLAEQKRRLALSESRLT